MKYKGIVEFLLRKPFCITLLQIKTAAADCSSCGVTQKNCIQLSYFLDCYIRSGVDTPSMVSTLRSVMRVAFTNTRRAAVSAWSSVSTRQLL